MKIHRDLGDKGFDFFIFDYAIIFYFKKFRHLDKNTIKSLFANTNIDRVFGIIDIVFEFLGIPAKGIIKQIGKVVGPAWGEYIKKRKINDKVIKDIQKFGENELLGYLPEYLARDINASMSKVKTPQRLVMFFDTYEALWGFEGKITSNHNYEMIDIWLRRFLTNLELKNGIVVVVAGREPPNWSNVNDYWEIPEEYIDLYAVDFLSSGDALTYLEKAGIEDGERREAIVSNIEEHGLVHPFLLGLCADAELAKIRRGIAFDSNDYPFEKRSQKILTQAIHRFLRYTDQDTSMAFKALSAFRTFDESLYHLLGEKLNFSHTATSFRTISGYSFVKEYTHSGEKGLATAGLCLPTVFCLFQSCINTTSA
ncbi:MAG: hypothetical protein PHG94_01875 [Syntrophomonas sp.]|nr:hypothetical protein [Syntrophomonas sp.]MDD4626212.1 hypothetical protein [Syntrophomonas sp.]